MDMHIIDGMKKEAKAFKYYAILGYILLAIYYLINNNFEGMTYILILITVIALIIIIVIVALAALYIYKAKKSGKKCIGCPGAAFCGRQNNEPGVCSGNCSACSGCCTADKTE